MNGLLALLGFRSGVMETIRGRSLQTYLETRAVKQTISDISGRDSKIASLNCFRTISIQNAATAIPYVKATLARVQISSVQDT